ncbi:MAG: restriction endonuclease subunit S [Schwartzia sp.]|nr:restriction endonuclease subunit S [Schwartzia sp. (in: firmicutes)]
MMTPQQLKNSILQRAIEGKLVEQRPEEGTAKELLKKIKAEKDRLVKEGKIKKTKPLPPITEDEIPFEIPENWEWVRLGEIFTTSSGTTPTKSNACYYNSGDYNWVRTTDLNNGVLRACEIKISALAKAECNLEILPRKSVCIAMYGGAGTIGKNALIDFDTTINQSVFAIHPNGFCEMRYVLYFIQNYRNRWMDFAVGSRKDPNINGNIIKNTLIPLPTLSEQQRIVSKIEELLPLVDEYDKTYSQITALNEKFPQDLKKSILQYAIEGKLVEQRPEEGTAADLLKEIKAEKAKLIKEGKIKKEKTLPPITENEIPFEIPGSWEWVRFGEITINRDNERIPLSVKQRTNLDKIYDYYGASGVIDKVDNFLFSEELLLIGEDGANLLMRSKPIAFIAKGRYWVNNHAHVIDVYSAICMQYLMYYINAINLVPYVTGTAQPKMNQAKMNSIPVPVPPLSEQQRIVERIEQLLPLCDKLM